jgi:hypothetical protein
MENEETKKQFILKEFKGLRVESDTERGTNGFHTLRSARSHDHLTIETKSPGLASRGTIEHKDDHDMKLRESKSMQRLRQAANEFTNERT